MVVEADGLTRRFGRHRVVDNVSLTIRHGEIVCLLGPSGCGKSTTLRMIAGVERPDAGSVWIGGRRMSGQGVFVPPERRAVGLMFQDFALFPHLDVARNIAFGAPRQGASQGIAEEMLERVGLPGYADRFPHELSGGEQQRVALARALAANPAVLLMDEPFSGLDNRLRDRVRSATLELLREAGTALLIVTHDPEEAMLVADRIALMRAGRVAQEGAPYEIYARPVDREAAEFFSDLVVFLGTVRNGAVTTAFGEFAAQGIADGVKAEVAVRPHHVKLVLDRSGRGPDATASHGVAAQARVIRARFAGRESVVDLRTEHDGAAVRAVLPGPFLPKPGVVLWVTIPRDRAMVFPAKTAR